MAQVPVVGVNVTEIVGLIVAGLVVLIPVVGWTARFALKPIAEAIIQIRDSGGEREVLEHRVRLLEARLGTGPSVAEARESDGGLLGSGGEEF